MTLPDLGTPSPARLRAAVLLARVAPSPDASPVEHAAFAAALRSDIAALRAAALSADEHGAYERLWQAATVEAEAVERLTLGRMQRTRALADLPAVLDAITDPQ